MDNPIILAAVVGGLFVLASAGLIWSLLRHNDEDDADD